MSLVPVDSKISQGKLTLAKSQFTSQQLDIIRQFRKLLSNNVVTYNIITSYVLLNSYFHEIICGLILDPGMSKNEFVKMAIRITSYIKMNRLQRLAEVKKLNYYKKCIKTQVKIRRKKCKYLTSFPEKCLIEGQIRNLNKVHYCYNRSASILKVMIEKE